MGAPKQKWTNEEESALRAGVEKYGHGKWRAIQKDPKFAPILKLRSNVDLKDKWRNLSASALPGGSRSAAKIAGLTPTGIRKLAMEPEMPSLGMDHSALQQFQEEVYMAMREPAPLKLPSEKSPTGTKYDDYILEAIAAMNQPEGSTIGDISTFVEGNHDVPHNFRNYLNSNLKSLMIQGKVVKVHDHYKIRTGAPKRRVEHENNLKRAREAAMAMTTANEVRSKRPRIDLETAQRIVMESDRAAARAARAIAEAEAAAHAAELAAKEADELEAFAERLEEAAARSRRPKHAHFAAHV